MSTAATVQPVERQGIHKSCRTIESLLSVLNDYCEIAGAFAAIRKKLSKALKDAAALKTNAQFAGESAPVSYVSLSDTPLAVSQCVRRERHRARSPRRH